MKTEYKNISNFEEMYLMALKGFNNAYAIYSNFNVGAAALLKNGEIIYGSNVENSSYGLSNCAERSTLFTVYSLGYRKDDIVKFMVIGNTNDPISPCGACRQVMSDLMNADCEVVLTNLKKDVIVLKVKELLPYSFSGDNLNE